MLQSKQQIPCFYLEAKANLTAMMTLRHKASKKAGVKITANDFFIRAIALAVEQYPLLAGRLVRDNIHIQDAVNVGFALTVAEGLIVPVVKDAGKKTLARIATETAELVKKIVKAVAPGHTGALQLGNTPSGSGITNQAITCITPVVQVRGHCRADDRPSVWPRGRIVHDILPKLLHP